MTTVKPSRTGLCQQCNSDRLIGIDAKCSDLCFTIHKQVEKDGYVPDDIGLGGGDYVQVTICLNCGHAQGTWPLPKSDIEKVADTQ